MPKLSEGAKIYRKFRHRKGHGIHSPFVYNLITKVIEEKSPYYVFEEIEIIRKKIIARHDEYSQMTLQGTQSRRYGELLFRLVNFFQCKNVLEIGSSTGIMSLYLAFPHSASQCVVLEENRDLKIFVDQVTSETELKNVKVECGDYLLKIKEILKEAPAFDLIFMNIRDCGLCENIFNACNISTHKNTVFVIDGINETKSMKILWQKLKERPEVSVSIDLYALGLLFLKENIHKQHYKVYFDDGKKQTLHKNRRQRLYFFSRRKKSFQNARSFRRLWNSR